MQLKQIPDTLVNERIRAQFKTKPWWWCSCFTKRPQLCLRIIMGQHQWVEPYTSPQQPWWLRVFSHPLKNQQNCTKTPKKPNKTFIPGPFLMTIILGEVMLEPCWCDLGRVATDALCCCFASNCSLFICGVFTEEPWQRQFSVTCRETSIKTLLLLILIIPTRNIWNKTAM